MSEQNKKQAIIETLDKVDKAELPLFIHKLKLKAFMSLALGEMSKETGDLLIETCTEYLRQYELEKYMEKVIDEKLQSAKTYHKPIVDISKLKPTEFMGVSE